MAFGSTATINRERLPEALAYFSLGLGAAEIAASHHLARFAGLPDTHRGLMRVMGIREVAAGAAILAEPLAPRWTWARVGGDALDLALMGLAFTSPRSQRGRLLASTIAVLGVTALDIVCARMLSQGRYRDVSRRRLSRGRGDRFQQSIAINCSPEQAYRFWRDFSNWPRVIGNMKSVRETIDKRLRFDADENGKDVQWDAEVLEDRPNELISWRSVGNTSVERAGSIRMFKAPADRGTIVRVELLHRPAVSWDMSKSVDSLIHESLRRMKALLETGEVPTTIGQPSARPSGSVPVDAEVGRPLGLRAMMAH